VTISSRDRAILAAIAAIAVLAGFYLFVLRPQNTRADQLASQVVTAQKQLAEAQSGYATGRAAQRRLATIGAEYAAAQRAVPAQSDIPGLLRLLQRTADAAHVSIVSISLSGSGSASTTPTAPAATTTATGTAAAAGPESVPVSLTFGGGYQALNRMVHQLDALVVVSRGRLRAAGPLVGISNVSLTPGTGGSSQLSVALSASIYQTAAASSTAGATSGGTS
jgi:Tfp pilus assembly protein PilO